MTICKLIASCRCGASFYDTQGGWQRMLSHITDESGKAHEWYHVSDLVVMQNSSGERETKWEWT